jgi:hypothetical protein
MELPIKELLVYHRRAVYALLLLFAFFYLYVCISPSIPTQPLI